MLANVAELGASRMEETIGTTGFRDAAIGTGIAVDKMLALTGQMPLVQVANVILPTPEERAKLDAIDSLMRSRGALLHRDQMPPKRARMPANKKRYFISPPVTDRRLIPIRD
jgi:hypothetical protein